MKSYPKSRCPFGPRPHETSQKSASTKGAEREGGDLTNVYFDLTEEFNAGGAIAALGSGQAVVFYRVSMMSKDGDWVLRETPEACGRVLSVLERHGARYRPGAPLDVRWLAGGWSAGVASLPLPAAHQRLVALAEQLLAATPPAESPADANAQ